MVPGWAERERRVADSQRADWIATASLHRPRARSLGRLGDDSPRQVAMRGLTDAYRGVLAAVLARIQRVDPFAAPPQPTAGKGAEATSY